MNRLLALAVLSMCIPAVVAAQQVAHEAEEGLALKLQDQTVLQIAKQVLASPHADAGPLLNLFSNKLIRPETDIVPAEFDPRSIRDSRFEVRTLQYTEFGCTLSLPWGMPTHYSVATNTAGVGYLHLHVEPGIAVTFWDPHRPSDIDAFFQEPIPAAVLSLGLDARTLGSQTSLWSRALHASSRDVHATDSVPHLTETTALLIYKMCVWPFKTDTLYEFHTGDRLVFQFGSPEKDRKVLLELFADGKHATLSVRPFKDSVRFTQRDVLDMIEGFQTSKDARINRPAAP